MCVFELTAEICVLLTRKRMDLPNIRTNTFTGSHIKVNYIVGHNLMIILDFTTLAHMYNEVTLGNSSFQCRVGKIINLSKNSAHKKVIFQQSKLSQSVIPDSE